MEQCIDKKILLQLHHGDMKAFEFVYHHSVGRIYNFIRSIVKDEVTSKDLTQDLFLQIWDKRENINCDDNFEGYLFRVCRNMVYHYIRRELLSQSYLISQDEKSDLATQNDMDTELDAKFLENYIVELIQELPEARRRVFMMYWKQELNYKEIAGQLSISEKTVATQVQRSLKYLRNRMGNVAFYMLLVVFIIEKEWIV